jgi:hypothetical protein
MKSFRAVMVRFAAPILVIGASAGQAFAGGIYGWGSAGCCGGSGGYGCSGGGVCGSGCGAWGSGGGSYGYGGCGPGGCGLGLAGGPCRTVPDYTPYIIGRGPMFPAGDYSPAYSYTAYSTQIAPDMSVGPKSR